MLRFGEKFMYYLPKVNVVYGKVISLDPDEMPSYSVFHPDPSKLTLRQHFQTLRNIEAL